MNILLNLLHSLPHLIFRGLLTDLLLSIIRVITFLPVNSLIVLNLIAVLANSLSLDWDALFILKSKIIRAVTTI